MAFRCKRRVLHIRLTSLIVTVCTMVALLAAMAQSASAFVACPSRENRSGAISRWTTLWPPARTDAKGVTMCLGEEGIWGTDKGYLQIVDLGDGAKLRLHALEDARSPEATESEPNTLYEKRQVEDWYEWLRGLTPIEEEEIEFYDFQYPRNERLFSTTNAGFFTTTENGTPTTIPFPLLTWGYHSSLGVSWSRGQRGSDFDYDASKKALLIGYPHEPEYEAEEVGPQEVRVGSFPTHYPRPFSGRYEETPNWEYWNYIERAEPTVSSSTMDAIVGFTPEVRIGESARRNYVGTYGDTVYIFTSDAEYTNAQASAIMQEIQSGMEVVQLDGGGSASLYSAYGQMDSNIPIWDREVPSVLAIYRAR